MNDDKVLRVRIDKKEWKEAKPFLKHGDISKIFRLALRAWLTEKKGGHE